MSFVMVTECARDGAVIQGLRDAGSFLFFEVKVGKTRKTKVPLDAAALAREHTEAAIKKIVAIMERDVLHALGLRAAQALLVRGWGRSRGAAGEIVLVPPIGRIERVIVDHRSHEKTGDQAERTVPMADPQI
jgi:hypothetical protein